MQTDMKLETEQKVDMVCSFLKNQIKPLYFRYMDRTVRILRTDMVNRMFRGNETIYFISASNDTACYYFRYETSTLRWILEKVWYKE